ncbi:MAG: carboxypeptidase-like regulatory domain-containing protein, partial [Bacteroidales bacterium]|nr:carboxypeptidase-like regulatory domain-containing protein [Bacteroidales bacterium]
MSSDGRLSVRHCLRLRPGEDNLRCNYRWGGEPLIGAAVVVEGNASIGSFTDLDGRYSITVPQDASSLVFSCIGMSDKVEPLSDIPIHEK